MSGGHWYYENDDLKRRIFEDVDEDGDVIYNPNPLNNQFLSDLTHDIFTILHSYDLFICGDISETAHEERVDAFLRTWREKFSQLDF